MGLLDELTPPNQQLVNYLLGLLPEEETERLDEASIADDDVASRLAGIEDDLVDAYVAGALDPQIREHFEAFYMKSPRRRGKVKFARRFLTVVDRASSVAAPTSALAGAGHRVRPFTPRSSEAVPVVRMPVRRTRFRWSMLTAAASVVITCGVMIRDAQLSRGLNQARQQGAMQDRRVDDLKKQLDETRNQNFQMAEALERARAAAAPLDRPSALALPALDPAIATRATILFPQTRSLGQPPTVNAGHGSSISLDLRLESNEFAQYRAVLRHPANNRVVWRSAALTARPGKPATVLLVVPANVLEAQHYSIELAGVNAAGIDTTISSYAFQIDWRARVP